ncbi:MAG: hypothetical protein KBF62_00905 [Candidatus Pacebacteria bacterium]|nr:hypothetical protein [Candidatus Paceibacterota bacterium]MBP9058180.1 hypothetical protein [Candidatus Paceibacterota bacterium]MBP9769902.1 hypothetical protein [Candidatus Paceibacterota bacterium]
MNYSKEFFKIQIEFAEKIASITGKSIEGVLLEYTCLYKRFGIQNWSFNKNELVWQEFLKEFRISKNKTSTVYEFQIKHAENKSEKEVFFGCFRYEYSADEKDVRIHFSSHGESGSLGKANIEKRKEDLRLMCVDIKNKYPETKTISGISWLFNIDACKRIFPPRFTDNAKVLEWYRSLAIWGQFSDSKGNIRPETAEKFKICFLKQGNLSDLLSCFPYKVLAPSTKIENFYKFYETKKEVFDISPSKNTKEG